MNRWGLLAFLFLFGDLIFFSNYRKKQGFVNEGEGGPGRLVFDFAGGEKRSAFLSFGCVGEPVRKR